METAGAARKLIPIAAWGSGAVTALVGTAGALLYAEATLARKTIGILTEDKPPDATGWYGRGRPGPALRVALLGDSSAAGYGVFRVEDTPGALSSPAVSRSTRIVASTSVSSVWLAPAPQAGSSRSTGPSQSARRSPSS